MLVQKINNLKEKLREILIEKTDEYYKADKVKFNIFCSCMDVIDDTMLAISNYIEKGLGADEAERYLKLYGLLQAVIIQQDSIIELYKLLKITYALKDGFKNIRRIRIIAGGHPTNFSRGEFCTFISRVTITNTTFEICCYDKKNEVNSHEKINLRESLNEHLSEFKDCLEDLIAIFEDTDSF